MSKMPIIGISSSIIVDNSGSFAGYMRAYVNKDYVDAVIRAGGVPLIIPFSVDKEVIISQAQLIDGLILSGGHDINPYNYGQEPSQKIGEIFPERDIYEMILLEESKKRDIPILGICRGFQLINVAAGGTLYQDLSLIPGNILKHNIPLDVNGKDIRSIITSKIKENKTLLIKIPQIKEILEILDEDTFLNTDVSLLSEKKQVILKILEIKYASFLGYTIVLKNTLPFIDDIQKNINEISKNNRLFLLDYKKISCTKEEILEAYYENNKLKRTSYLYEIFGYKKISTIINKIRKEKVCQYCNGKGKLREENLYENIDITETPCSFCNETGLSIEGLNTEIEGISIKEWYYGSIDRINKDLPDELKNLSLMSKICDLNKEQLIKLKEYLK